MNGMQIVKMLLLEGNSNGRIMCDLDNWIGNSYKIPRSLVKKCSDRKDLNNTGIYILFGKREDKNVAYIGEAEDIFARLKQHLERKEFWNECVVFISKDNNLNKAHVKYIENKLYNIAVNTDRYLIENRSVPTESSLSEFDIIDMNKFIDSIKLITSIYGYKIFDEIIEKEELKIENILTIEKKNRNILAKALITGEGLVVMKGSKASETFTDGTTDCFKISGAKLKSEGIIDSNNEFTRDYIFTSPSAAAVIILGRNANGLSEWKNKDGKSLKELGY